MIAAVYGDGFVNTPVKPVLFIEDPGPAALARRFHMDEAPDDWEVDTTPETNRTLGTLYQMTCGEDEDHRFIGVFEVTIENPA